MSDTDEYHDEYEGLMRKALHVDLPDDFDPNSTPQTGEEYLQHVMYERTKCQEWIVANNLDRNKFKNNQTFKVEIDNTVIKRPTAFKPSQEWQQHVIDEFKTYRRFIEFLRKEEPQIETFNEKDFLDSIESSVPLLSNLFHYVQCCKIRMLQILTKYLDSIESGKSFSEQIGIWIYAVLSLLDIPLSPSACHSLREFAKKCTLIRSNLPEDADEKVYIPLNLYICIVARFFNQLDLVDQ